MRTLFLIIMVGFIIGMNGPLVRADTDDASSELNAPTRSIASDSRAPAAKSEDGDDDEYNFSWLDPDKKVYVLQNRKYRKKMRFGISLSGGANMNNPYRTEYLGLPRASFWILETLGIEAFYGLFSNSDNSNLTALKNASPTALPFVRETRNYLAMVATWAPFYAKINFFNKILYFDWFFNAGAGQVGTAVDQNRRAGNASSFVTENLFGFFYGTGQNFFVTKHILVRWDLIGHAYSATGADNVTKSLRANYDFALGLGYLF